MQGPSVQLLAMTTRVALETLTYDVTEKGKGILTEVDEKPTWNWGGGSTRIPNEEGI